MRPFRHLVVPCIAAGLLWASPAAAWGPAVTLPAPPGTELINLALPQTGGPIAVLDPGDLRGPVTATTGADGSFGAPVRLIGDRLPAGQAVTGAVVTTSENGRIAVVLSTSTAVPSRPPFAGTGPGPSWILVALGRPGAPLRIVLRHRATSSFSRALGVAVNRRGDAAAVFAHCGARCVTFAAFRRAGGGFGTPLRLAQRSFGSAGDVTLNRHGDALVAWARSRGDQRVRDAWAAVRRASGRLGGAHRLGPAQGARFALTLSEQRVGVVAWHDQASSEGAVGGPVTVAVARLAAGGGVVPARTLESSPPAGAEGSAISGPRIRSAIDAGGSTTIAWSGLLGTRYVVRAIRVPADRAPQIVSRPQVNAVLTGFGGAPSGDAMIAWAEGFGGSDPDSFDTPKGAIYLVRRSLAALSFGPPEVVAPGPAVQWSGIPAIAVDGRRAVVGWQPGGPNFGRPLGSVQVAAEDAPFP